MIAPANPRPCPSSRPARLAVIALFACACGVPQEIFNTRLRELDRCHADLTRAQGDLSATRQNADELANQTSEMRERVNTLETDRMRLSSTLSSQKQNLELYKNAATLAQRRADLYLLLSEKLKPLVDGKQIAIDTAKGKFLIRFADASLFDAGRAELRPEGQTLLREIGAVLKIVNRDVLVACHTDNQALAKGSPFKSNWELTTARAVAVVRFFQGEGLDPRHLGAAGYSEFSFLGENGDSEGRAQNRRVELVVMPAADELLPLPPEVTKPALPHPPPSP